MLICSHHVFGSMLALLVRSSQFRHSFPGFLVRMSLSVAAWTPYFLQTVPFATKQHAVINLELVGDDVRISWENVLPDELVLDDTVASNEFPTQIDPPLVFVQNQALRETSFELFVTFYLLRWNQTKYSVTFTVSQMDKGRVTSIFVHKQFSSLSMAVHFGSHLRPHQSPYEHLGARGRFSIHALLQSWLNVRITQVVQYPLTFKSS